MWKEVYLLCTNFSATHTPSATLRRQQHSNFIDFVVDRKPVLLSYRKGRYHHLYIKVCTDRNSKACGLNRGTEITISMHGNFFGDWSEYFINKCNIHSIA